MLTMCTAPYSDVSRAPVASRAGARIETLEIELSFHSQQYHQIGQAFDEPQLSWGAIFAVAIAGVVAVLALLGKWGML
jgi:hypothetical protein